MITRLCRALRGILFGILILIKGALYHGKTKNAAGQNAWQRQEGKKRLLGADYLEPVVQIPP